MHLQTSVNPGLTFAALHALKPGVFKFSIALASTILIPSTARSATTDSSGFLERAAVRTHHNSRGDAWGGDRHGDWNAGYSPSCKPSLR